MKDRKEQKVNGNYMDKSVSKGERIRVNKGRWWTDEEWSTEVEIKNKVIHDT